ncbi:hypothetical protein Ancab_032117 [Ancistrocladus abbreviatus]
MASFGLSKFLNLSTVKGEDLRVGNFRIVTFVEPAFVSRTNDIHLYKNRNRLLVVNSIKPQDKPEVGVGSITVSGGEDAHSVGNDVRILEDGYVPKCDYEDGGGDVSDGNGGKGKSWGGGGDHDGNGNEDKDKEEEEFGPIMKFEEVIRETQSRGASLPADMLEAAKSVGIRRMLLLRYLDLQGSAWPLGFAMRSCSMLRNRMLADPSFLFKVGTEIMIDSCCATFAEVQKRGKDFWAEFELYVADLLVGIVVNVALVGMLAPYARIGQPSMSKGFLGRLQQSYSALPSSVFEAERPGCRFTINQRLATYFYKGILYGSVGFACGLIGQGIANLIMTMKRSIRKSEEDIPVPPLVKSAALWEMKRIWVLLGRLPHCSQYLPSIRLPSISLSSSPFPSALRTSFDDRPTPSSVLRNLIRHPIALLLSIPHLKHLRQCLGIYSKITSLSYGFLLCP